jgi:hypothetical protein
MEFSEIQASVKRFRDYVVQQSRSNLTRKGKNVTSKLYKSIQGEVLTERNYILVGFTMEDYAAYQDQGVKGSKTAKKAPNSPFKFGTKSGKKGGLTKGIEKWVVRKGIQFRDKKSGRYLTYKSTAFIITRSIFTTGLKPSLFFTKPFEAGFKKYIDVDLMKAFSVDIERLISYNLPSK